LVVVDERTQIISSATLIVCANDEVC